MDRIDTDRADDLGGSRRPGASVRRMLVAALAAALVACTSTYVQDDMSELPGATSEAPCKPGDTRPGCEMESPVCQDSTEYLCDPL